MDIKEYVTAQLSRTKNKKYEAYVIHRIINKLDDFGIKFVTQQYVSRGIKGWYLTGLYFPQIELHVEVDEAVHLTRQETDKARERDIVNMTDGHIIMRVETANASLEEINSKIDKIIDVIRDRKKEMAIARWDINKEYDYKNYIETGEIDASKEISLLTTADVCNCFGHNYKIWRKGGAAHPDENTILWFPKLYKNGQWDNRITDDEKTISEENLDPKKTQAHVEKHLNRDTEKRRVVFARVRGNLGDVMYRFRGIYLLDEAESKKAGKLIWHRVATVAKTFPQSLEKNRIAL